MKFFEILYRINNDNSKDESLVNKIFKFSFKKCKRRKLLFKR